MKKNNSIIRNVIIGIATLFIISSVTPMVIGYNIASSERDEFLEKLAFGYSTGCDSSRVSYYRKHLLKSYSSDIVEIEIEKIGILRIPVVNEN